jgi:hypothetical protein
MICTPPSLLDASHGRKTVGSTVAPIKIAQEIDRNIIYLGINHLSPYEQLADSYGDSVVA